MTEAEKVAEAEARELLVLEVLDAAYHMGKLNYVQFSAARDATEARIAALGWYKDWLEE